jgi:diacylglycerol kinase (ATP)
MSNNVSIINKQNGAGIRRIFKASHCSYKGFKAAWQHESAFRQELVLVTLMMPFSFLLSTSSHHWLMLMASLLFLLFAEIINSGLEALADKICLSQDPLIGRAKDMGSAGVFLALCLLGLIWGEALYSIF